jgi:hypothetical protein
MVNNEHGFVGPGAAPGLKERESLMIQSHPRLSVLLLLLLLVGLVVLAALGADADVDGWTW